MPTLARVSLVFALAVLAGCASQLPAGLAGKHATQPSAGPSQRAPQPPAALAGEHLVYRDASGTATRQFDYPDAALCQKVEALAGGGARCQAEPAPGLAARARLLYVSQGFVVEGHYADMNRCHTDTRALLPGVQLVAACSDRRAQGAATPRVEAPQASPAVAAPAPTPPLQRTDPEPPAAQQMPTPPQQVPAPQQVAPSQQEAPPRQPATQPPANRPSCSTAHQAAGLCHSR